MYACWKTRASISSFSCTSLDRDAIDSCIRSRYASVVSSVMVVSVTKSNNSFEVMVGTPRLPKKSVMLRQSLRRKSSACGWSCSTLWLTSMMYRMPLWYRMLYSDKSACTNRHTW
eukprot:Mycagemm_TRINITY_DN9343_c0_g1::TRINITY_DN9343_c0_g1_i1::g.3139::m.3139 type:complete len:115 gc:universal TRINITY_DN9343_c0_g1_i1:450-794(+)